MREWLSAVGLLVDSIANHEGVAILYHNLGYAADKAWQGGQRWSSKGSNASMLCLRCCSPIRQVECIVRSYWRKQLLDGCSGLTWP